VSLEKGGGEPGEILSTGEGEIASGRHRKRAKKRKIQRGRFAARLILEKDAVGVTGRKKKRSLENALQFKTS